MGETAELALALTERAEDAGAMSRRASRLTPKGHHTRQRIIEAANRLIGSHGAVRVTLDDVRAEANVSSSQIYHYFADKQALLSAVVAYQDAQPFVGESMAGGFDSADAVRSWGQRLIEGQRESKYEGGCPIASLGTGVMGLDPDTLNQIARMFRRCEDGIRAGYQTMHANHEIAPDADPEALATLTLATAIGGLVLAQLNRDTEPLQAALDALLDCLHIQGPAASIALVSN
jgi:TetR/AcrR family transcriptional regulator, transcriptional repressor for nem operon